MSKKRVVTLFETLPLDTPVAKEPLQETPDYCIKIESTKGLPEPVENLKTSKLVPGSFFWLPYAFVGQPCFLDDTSDKIALCLSILREIDKGNNGFFNNAYFMNCDMLTPTLKQYEYFQQQFMRSVQNNEQVTENTCLAQFGAQMRLYLRGIVFRLFSYYYMGYKVSFSKYVPANISEKE